MGLKNVVRATIFATKRADISDEEFSRRFAKHGLMAGKVMLKYNVISYHQQHKQMKYESEFKAALGPEKSTFFDFIDADGLITVIFPTMADLSGFLADPAHQDYLNADVAEYATLGTVRITLGDEYRVIEAGVLLG